MSRRSLRSTRWPVMLVTLFAAVILSPGAAAIGILVPTQPGVPPLRLVHHRVQVEVTERGAVTKVTQEFDNPTPRQLEATYLFPLPQGATVDEFALWMNGRRETGKVMERGEARRIYESIVRRARDPGLIEYVDAQLFQARVFPIPPNGRQKVELIYSHLVDYEAGLHRYVYPLRTDSQATTTLQDFTLSVRVKSKLPIRNLCSPTHRVAARTRGTTGMAGFEKDAFTLADDFVLYWSVDDKDVGLTVLTYREADDPGYFLLLASPKDNFRDREIIGKRVSFVVDTSGSMAGEKMDATRAALDYCLSQLGEDDIFNVISFGSYVEPFSKRMVAANTANVKKARGFVRELEPLGGTNIDEALTTALASAGSSSKAPHMVVFLTDGRPTVGDTEVANILGHVGDKNRSGARVFVFGVGNDVNAVLLDKLAEQNGGRASYLRGDASLEQEVKTFYDRVSHPVLSNLKLEIDGVRTFGEHPRRLPDLFKGGQIVLLGRYRSSGRATVSLSGDTPGGRRRFSYRANFAAGSTEHRFIPRLWAQRQVGMLLGEIREKGETRGLVDEVTQLATAFGIVTPYTSYLVVEPGATPQAVRRGDMIGGRDRRGGGRGEARPTTTDEDLGFFAPDAEEAEAAPPPAGDSPSLGGSPAPASSGVRVARPKKSAKAREALRTESGEGAVAAAKEIGRLRDSTVASERKVATAVARALGRTFRFTSGVWIDEKVAAKDKILTVKAYSPAYFAALRLRPELKEALKLGERVKVKVAKGRTLIIDPKGAERVADGKLKAFLAK